MRKTRLGQELIAGMHEALAHARGEKRLREHVLEVPDPVKPWSRKKIVALRKERYHVSQPIFAAMLNVTASTVRAWEQGQKTPSGAASRLLQIAEADPAVFQHLARGPKAGRSMGSQGRLGSR